MEPHITYRGMEHSTAMDTKIQELTDKLESFHPKITRCTVIVDKRDHRKRKGNLFEVRVDVHVPGREIVASMLENEDPYIALHQAFDVAQRQLEEDIRRKRGEVKTKHEERGDDSTP
jgi:ribosomal subunit interface protein